MIEWSSKNFNLSVDQEEVYQGYRSVIACMTEDKGIDHCQIYDDAINADIFVAYLKALRVKHGKRPIALFMDRLNVHKANNVKPWYQKLRISPLFNARYSPETNPIEAVFSKVKAVFNRKRLSALVNKEGFNFDREITAAFKVITTDHCAACVRKSLFLLERAA